MDDEEESEEDISELESRLYAQIHHKMDEPELDEAAKRREQQQLAEWQSPSAPSRVPSTRYWVCGYDTGNAASRSPMTPAPKKTQYSLVNKINAAVDSLPPPITKETPPRAAPVTVRTVTITNNSNNNNPSARGPNMPATPKAVPAMGNKSPALTKGAAPSTARLPAKASPKTQPTEAMQQKQQQQQQQWTKEYYWPRREQEREQQPSKQQQKPPQQRSQQPKQQQQQFIVPNPVAAKPMAGQKKKQKQQQGKKAPQPFGQQKKQQQQQQQQQQRPPTPPPPAKIEIDGPEARKQAKRARAERLAEKRAKSVRAHATAKRTAAAAGQHPIITIYVDESDEDDVVPVKPRDLPKTKRPPVAAVGNADEGDDVDDDDDEVILVPVPPPPCISVDTESEEEQDDKQQVAVAIKPLERLLVIDENAMDVPTDNETFLRPRGQQISQHGSPSTHTMPTALNSASKRANETPSRCTSPSSVQSSDDFIGQADRTRLLQRDAHGGADDEDLFGLTNDAPDDSETSTNLVVGEAHVAAHVSASSTRKNATKGRTNTTVNTTPMTPTTTAMNHFRVDSLPYRRLEVYESESDMTSESVYTKGATRSSVPAMPSIIRAISSSEEDDEQGEDQLPAAVDSHSSAGTAKRRRKRHASISIQRDSTARQSSDDYNDDDDDDDAVVAMAALPPPTSLPDDVSGVSTTAVPFISRGIALERSRKPLPSSATSSTSFAQRKGRLSSGGQQMSDSAFIATLNNLAQGGAAEVFSDGDSDSMDEAPSARDIAEKVLGTTTPKQAKPSSSKSTPGVTKKRNSTKQSKAVTVAAATPLSSAVAPRRALTACSFAPVIVPVGAALPDDSLSNLDRVFETIDALELLKSQPLLDTPEPPESRTPTPEVEDSDDSDVQMREGEAAAGPQSLIDADGRRDPQYNVIYSHGGQFPGGIGWNDEMRRFYNNSWHGETFSLPSIWQRMNTTKRLWRILPDDRFPRDRGPRSNQKCHNCSEMGHTRAKCKQPKKVPICYMCGERGHYEPRCPNTLCLRCGNKTRVFTKSCNACVFQNRLICPLCKVRGHTLNGCPDKWRRYHSTIEMNAYPNSELEYKRRKFCSICARIGHLSDTCKSALRFLEYPVIVCHIKSHQKSYDDQPLSKADHRHLGIGYNLLYRPRDDYSFELAENTGRDKYYGRFLRAVGMSFLLRRKRRVSAPTASVEAGTTAAAVESMAPSAKRLSLQPYKSNAQARMAATQQQQQPRHAGPEQVQEVSKSGIRDDDCEAPTTSKAAKRRAAVVEKAAQDDAESNDKISSTQLEQEDMDEEAVEVVEQALMADEDSSAEYVVVDEAGMEDEEEVTQVLEPKEEEEESVHVLEQEEGEAEVAAEQEQEEEMVVVLVEPEEFEAKPLQEETMATPGHQPEVASEGCDLAELLVEVQAPDVAAFKSPCIASTSSAAAAVVSPPALSPVAATGAAILPSTPPHLDSDSNYSFSEHFDVSQGSPPQRPPAAALSAVVNSSRPTTTTTTTSTPTTITTTTAVMTTTKPAAALPPKRPPPRTMEPLPDFIPLSGGTARATDDNDYDDDDDDDGDDDADGALLAKSTSRPTGISRCFIPAESDDDDDDDGDGIVQNLAPLTELPCEAKIYLSHFHSKYLLSPIGNEFLMATSKAAEVRCRLDFTSVGHVLILFGTPTQQDAFHRDLLHKYRELTDQMLKKRQDNGQKVPKRADVLIRFLRDNIQQLLANTAQLGNVNDLWRRLRNVEEQSARPSKAGFKMAERIRRTLNMILIGQAGLLDGSRHLDNLLMSLKQLVTEYSADEVIPHELRQEIDSHWKMIFTSYRHDNYAQLVETYKQMASKNRIPRLNIDPVLLGLKTIDTTLTAEQRERLQGQPHGKGPLGQGQVPSHLVPNPLNPSNAKRLRTPTNKGQAAASATRHHDAE